MSYKSQKRTPRQYATPTSSLLDVAPVETPTNSDDHLAYVRGDLMRVGIIATVLIAVLVALSFVL
ncbi:MAG TPA: hypothetical protein PK299_15135 [Anaerolineales bacterium]|nr:hypothetical protein [Anaerolineales bacterium]